MTSSFTVKSIGTDWLRNNRNVNKAMYILNLYGGMTMCRCEEVRKSIVKKDQHRIEAHKSAFFSNARFYFNDTKIEELWDKVISAFTGDNKIQKVVDLI